MASGNDLMEGDWENICFYVLVNIEVVAVRGKDGGQVPYRDKTIERGNSGILGNFQTLHLTNTTI